MEAWYKLLHWTVIIMIVADLLQFQGAEAKGGSKLKPKPGGKGSGRNNRRYPISGGTGGSSGSSSYDNNMPFDQLGNYVFRNASHEERLLAYLFHNYDEVARATLDSSKTVEVQISLVLLRIHGLDERKQVLSTTGLIISEWFDDRLKWDPEKFGNLTTIIIKADRIWLPELALMNGAEELMPDFERIRVLLRYDGMLHWEPGGIFHTTCDIDITYFPFDIQRCPILIGAYSYFDSKMNITSVQDHIILQDYRPNGEWRIHSTTTNWSITTLQGYAETTGYAHVIFTLHLKRRYLYYIMNIVCPCVMLSFLIMTSFLLPPDSGEKVSLGISVLLAFTVFLIMIAEVIPRTSLTIPLMVIYLTATMFLGTLSIIMTVFVLNIHHRAPRFELNPKMKLFVLHYMARIFCVNTHYRQTKGRRKIAALLQRQGEKEEEEKPKTSSIRFSVIKEKLFRRGKQKTKESAQAQYQNDRLLDEMENKGPINVLKQNRRVVANGPTSVGLQHHVEPFIELANHVPPVSPNRLSLSPENGMLSSRRKRFLRREAFGDSSNPSSPRENMSLSTDTADEPDHSRDWHELALVLDRLFFWITLLFTALSALSVLLFPKYTGQEYEELNLVTGNGE